MGKEYLNYNPQLVQLARKLRNNSTLSEKLLWNYLKGKKIDGYDFDRQKPVDDFIIDFYCKKLKLAIEIDGSTHNFKINNDQVRQKKLEGLGIKFLRFTDKEVIKNVEGIAAYIRGWIQNSTFNDVSYPPPAPPKEGR